MPSIKFWGIIGVINHQFFKNAPKISSMKLLMKGQDMRLTDTLCKQAKPQIKPKRIYDGAGLYLEIVPNGSKYWRFKYRYDNKEKRLAIGAYPTISLKQARVKREDAKRLLADDIDPSKHKQQKKRERILKAKNSFEKVAREWHEVQSTAWTPNHSKTVMMRLETDIFPEIGKMPINEVTPPILLDALRKIEKRGALDIAKRAKQTVGQICRYAIAIGMAERDISADLRGVLKTAPKSHFNYLQETELPEFLQKLAQYDGDRQTRIAVRFTLLTFVRTGEIRGAQWHEFDFNKNLWRIPAERMKMRTPHIVPLSRQVLELLAEMKTISHNALFLFPNRSNSQKPMSENTMLYALYRMGYHERATIHGFRATASTILNENGFRSDVIERQLAHGERNNVRAAYNHAQYLSERTVMMQEWADYIDRLALRKS